MSVIENVKHYLNETNTSQAKLAKEAGINAGALSAYLNDNYKGSIAEMEAKLTAYLNRKATKVHEFVEAPAFIETATAKQIFKTLEFAQIANCMATVYGASGVGKTKAIQHFAQHRANVWLVTASPSRSSLSEILYEIALELGIRVNDPAKMYQADAGRSSKSDPLRLLINALLFQQGITWYALWKLS